VLNSGVVIILIGELSSIVQYLRKGSTSLDLLAFISAKIII